MSWKFVSLQELIWNRVWDVADRHLWEGVFDQICVDNLLIGFQKMSRSVILQLLGSCLSELSTESV